MKIRQSQLTVLKWSSVVTHEVAHVMIQQSILVYDASAAVGISFILKIVDFGPLLIPQEPPVLLKRSPYVAQIVI